MPDSLEDQKSLPLEKLRWRCDPEELAFETTESVEGTEQIVGQSRAIEALEFGIGIDSEGYNLYALGPSGMGKHDVVEKYLEAQAEQETAPPDFCYVYNFDNEDEPSVLELPAGRGPELRDDVRELVEELKASIPAAFESEDYQTRRHGIDEEFQNRQEEIFEKIQEDAEEHDITILRTPAGIALAPVKDGDVIPPNEFDELDEEERESVEAEIERLQKKFQDALRDVPRWERERRERIRELNREVTKFAVEEPFEQIKEAYSEFDAVVNYLEAMQDDVIDSAIDFVRAMEMEHQNPMGGAPPMEGGQGQQPQMMPPDAQFGGLGDGGGDLFRRYRVNVLINNEDLDGAPVIYEDYPTLDNLVGNIEHIAQFGTLITDFNLIRPGALHRANGGYLILDARKLLMQGMSWEQLKRALRSGEIKIETLQQALGLASTTSLEPEPIDLDIKIVLVGERRLYYLLNAFDPDFEELFKVAADFENDMERESNEESFTCMLASFVETEDLRHFDATAVAEVLEHSVRVAGDQDKLSAHTESIKDLLREADHWADREESELVEKRHVRDAVEARRRRQSRIRDRVQEQIHKETLLIDTEGKQEGQINGLAVLQLGQFTFGKPNRITARTRLGKGEVIDIEREAELGGPIHSKGVMVVSGLLGGRFGQDKPLSLAASLVFEQSYSGVDGDSASLAEICALLSDLAGLPINQEYAVTGSINQHGRVQAIGGVNEKIEGFFEVCQRRGLTGSQGVIIPGSNIRHLMLREPVLDAVDNGNFDIYPVETVDEAIEILTGTPAGKPDAAGDFPDDSVNGLVDQRLADLADRAKSYASDSEE